MPLSRLIPARRLAALLSAPLLLAPLAVASPAAAVSPDLVISQVYGGGGNSGATLRNDFIEIHNRSASAVDVTGYTVQYASAAGTTWARTALSGTVAPGGYYLVQEAAGTAGTAALPAPDATGSIAMSATNGKVALVRSPDMLMCGADCDTAPGVVDFVGYGSANDFEGPAAAPLLSNTTAALRGDTGCAETDTNSTDFTTGAPAPRNSASTPNVCGGPPPGDSAPTVASTTPAGGATEIAVGSTLTVTFSEPVDLAAGAVSLSCSTSGAVAVTVTGGPTTYTVDPDTDLAGGETCTASLTADLVTDQDANDPPDTLAADYAWNFQTAAPLVIRKVHDVQGAAHLSPLADQLVAVEAVVTAVRSNGFFVQEEVLDQDADVATSEGILVFTRTAPAVAVGDLVRVAGTVAEFRPGGATGPNLSTTEITSPTVTTLATGVELPPTTVLGAGGRVPPSAVIDDDATGSVETSGTFDATTDGIDFYESLEGMRVQVNDAVATGPTSGFAEIPVVADNGADAGLRTARGGVVVRPGDFNPERIIVDDAIVGAAQMPVVNVGATFAEPIIGVIDYSFGNFKLLATAPPVVGTDALQRELTRDSVEDELSVANFNVENLDPADGPAKFDALAGLIVGNLRSPDLVILEEVQDNNGATNDAVVDASATLAALSAAVTAAGGPAYEYRVIDPVDDQDGGEPGGNIRVAFMFRTDRGLSFVDRPGGDSTTPVEVVSGPSGPELSVSPGRIQPADPAWSRSRKPLAGEFLYNGHRVFVVANHFNSKGGDQPLFGRYQPPALVSEAQRVAQATLVKAFVDEIVSRDPDAKVIVGGDLNDFEFSPPLQVLTGDGTLTSLVTTLPENERYSYVFEGNSQTLDHILASRALLPVADFDIVHVNAEFAQQTSDHDPSVARFLLPDEEPVITDVTGGGSVSCGGSSSATVTFADDSIGDTHDATVDWGDGTSSTFTDVSSGFQATHAYARAGRHTATVTVTDSAGGSDTATVDLVVNYTVVGGGLRAPLSSTQATTVWFRSYTLVRVALADCDGSRPRGLAPRLTVTKPGFAKDFGSLRYLLGEYVLLLDTRTLPGRDTYTLTVTVPETGQQVTGTIRVR